MMSKMDFFQRQILFLGQEKQKKLSASNILIAGIGGLGTHVAQFLVRAGIGTLYLVENGVIDAPDLNRQILYKKKDMGRSKVLTAKKALDSIGLPTKIEIIEKRIDGNFSLPTGIDGCIDCLDNFASRYLLDDLVQKYSPPVFFIHGGIYQMYGQITTIIPGKTKRLREVFSNQQESSQRVPVMITSPAIVASLQAAEAIKQICGLEPNLTNRLLLIDLSTYSFEMITL